MLEKSGGAKGSINSNMADAIFPVNSGTSSQPHLQSKPRMTILPQVKMQIGYSNFIDLSGGCREAMSSSLSQRCGSGKMIVEFFSEAISVNVWR